MVTAHAVCVPMCYVCAHAHAPVRPSAKVAKLCTLAERMLAIKIINHYTYTAYLHRFDCSARANTQHSTKWLAFITHFHLLACLPAFLRLLYLKGKIVQQQQKKYDNTYFRKSRIWTLIVMPNTPDKSYIICTNINTHTYEFMPAHAFIQTCNNHNNWVYIVYICIYISLLLLCESICNLISGDSSSTSYTTIIIIKYSDDSYDGRVSPSISLSLIFLYTIIL